MLISGLDVADIDVGKSQCVLSYTRGFCLNKIFKTNVLLDIHFLIITMMVAYILATVRAPNGYGIKMIVSKIGMFVYNEPTGFLVIKF